jgi:hypothetical protein
MNPPSSTIRPRNAYGRQRTLPGLQEFAENLKTAVNQCLPTFQKPFGQVAVLAIHWENTDLLVAPLEVEILEVFRDIYLFNTEKFLIPYPGGNAQYATQRRLMNFVKKWETEDALMIIIYSGHANEAPLGVARANWQI